MSAATRTQPSHSAPTAGFMPVQVEMFQRLVRTNVDLFVQYKQNTEPVLYRRAGVPLDGDQTARLIQAGLRQVFVRIHDFKAFTAELLAAVDAGYEAGQIVPAERFAALQLAMAVEIEHAANLLDCGPYVALAEKLSRDLTSILVNNNVLPADLYCLARHDFSTFTHITNVAGYGVLLAEALGYCPDGNYEPVAKAAMLHDIGKRFIPASILAKPSKLTPEERLIIENHPQRGYEELCERGNMSHDQLMMVYQHHERIDGTGYPVGYQGEEIHPWARMIAVVDVFDAMTGVRPYRRPCSPQQAVDYICKNAGTCFDPEIVACWKSTIIPR